MSAAPAELSLEQLEESWQQAKRLEKQEGG
jgi:hypothetical protein